MKTFRRGGIYRPRFMWWYPWTVTRPWLPKIWRGGDEWCNDSACVKVPFLGAFILFWRPGKLRTMPCPEEWDAMCADQQADYAPCGWLHGGRVRDGGHEHVMTGACDEARVWLERLPSPLAARLVRG